MSDQTFRVICRFDEALDAMAMGKEAVERFRETGDPSVAKFLEGARPAVFFCRRLKVSEMQAVRGYPTEAEQLTAAFARGLIRCEDLYMENGERRNWERPDQTRPVAPSSIDEVFDFGTVQEVGAAIYGRSILGKGRPAAWPLPATSSAAVGALVFHRVEQMRARDASSAQSKSEVGQEATAPGPSPG